jgi:metal-responsive CopG/Arc/MetJ family transcriptional regulator
MQPVSSRLDADTLRMVDDTADANDESRAEAIRRLVERGLEYDDLQRELERLENEKRTLIADREENQELVRFAESQRELAEYERERRKRGVFTRFRYWLTGED